MVISINRLSERQFFVMSFLFDIHKLIFFIEQNFTFLESFNLATDLIFIVQ
ncbi:hypothetical protein ABIC12_003537 [Pantoea agglomerans]